MKNSSFFNKFYLDREKDIIVNLYKNSENELTYIIETPNHKSGNLITNLAKLCNLETSQNTDGLKIIVGTIPASLNDSMEDVFIFRLGGIKIANIYADGRIEMKAKIPAITKTLMSQTKNYKIDIKKTIVKSYILKKLKFRTDLHTHIHANLSSDDLIALGIKHQIEYPLYYIRKLDLKLSDKQKAEIFTQRCEKEKEYAYSELVGKQLTRKIDDETVINFADLLLNNPENMEENIAKIRNSLVLMKDGQAVFTNLEKLYLYRYVFSKGKISKNKIDITSDMINSIPERDIKAILTKMMQDSTSEEYKNNSLLQDKLLWVARNYKKQGIEYAEISVTWIVRKGEAGVQILEELHECLPKIEKETGVRLRFLGSISRTLMTEEQLLEAVDIIKAAAKSPYIVGSDVIGEEINDIRKFKPLLKELVEFAVKQDNGFTVRIHAGENDSFRENVKRSVECVIDSVPAGQKTPRCRIGHGLYGIDLNKKDGIELLETMKKHGIVLEFQLTSNVRLNNLNEIENHPIKQYLKNSVSCVQGTDGCGFYGTDCMEEQLALINILDLSEQDLAAMKSVEDKIIADSDTYFAIKQKEFEKWLNGRSLKEAFLEEEYKNLEASKDKKIVLELNKKVNSETEFKEKIRTIPTDKLPIIIAGGSFNSDNRQTELTDEGKQILTDLIKKVNSDKVCFVVGHKMQGYEKAIFDISKDLNKKIEVDAIIPKFISEEEKENLIKNNLNGFRISTQSEELGIYKSFNYEIFERRNSVVLAFDGNSPVSNLVQEAKNGKGKAKIYVNDKTPALSEKAKSLQGYVIPFAEEKNIVDKILEDNPDIKDN